MNRRDSLKLLAALPLVVPFSIHAGTVLAAPERTPRLLVVFLRGGYDAASLLVPTSSNFYYEARPHIAIARPGTGDAAALPLDRDWGLHPALRETMYPLYQSGQVAFIPFAGTHDLSRSHFETQDTIELGQALEQRRDYRSGFLNRLAATLNGAGAIAFTEQLPIILQGTRDVANTSVGNAGKAAIDRRQSDIIAAMYQHTALSQQVTQGFEVRAEVQRDMASEMDGASRQAVSTKGFALEARRIARLMKEKYAIGFIDVGGWDIHVGQGAASGPLASRLGDLGQGLAAFADECGSQWRNTVVVVVSEFGRTFRENGNRGTDHGHGSVYWVLGGAVHGGRIAGNQVPVTQASLFQNRDYPVLNEYRAVLGGLFTRLYGLDRRQLDTVFNGVQSADIGLV